MMIMSTRMTDLEAYLAFRKEIDTMFYSEFKKWTNILTKKDKEGQTYALLIVEDGYIDCLWVSPEYRGKGIGYELVMEYIEEYEMPKTLRILNNNPNAQRFWNEIFDIREISSNPYDTLYLIIGIKNRKEE